MTRGRRSLSDSGTVNSGTDDDDVEALAQLSAPSSR